jgi:hypothetical protein
MSKEFWQALILGIILGMVFWIAGISESFIGILVSLGTCILFGPLTVWKIKRDPNIYALVVSVISGIFLVIAYGPQMGMAFFVGVLFIYGIVSVQLSMVMVNSYDNILFIIEKFKGRK